MAILTVYNIDVLDRLNGEPTLTSQGPARVSLTFPGNVAVHLNGAFTLSGGEVTGGTVTGIEYWLNGAPAVMASNLGFTLAQFTTASALGTTNALFYGGDDQFFGSDGSEILTPQGGADTVIALGGDDTINGAAGNDDLNGNKGQDVVHGDDGADTVRGGQGNDAVYGDAGDDPHVNGNIGDDFVFGGTGNDTLYGGQGADTLDGGSGIDLLSGDLGNDMLRGGAGGDHFMTRAGSGVDWIADFNASEGDRIRLAPGTAYSVTSFQGQVMLDLGGGDQLGLAGIAGGTFNSAWVVFA